jgi:hypothetical protein
MALYSGFQRQTEAPFLPKVDIEGVILTSSKECSPGKSQNFNSCLIEVIEERANYREELTRPAESPSNTAEQDRGRDKDELGQCSPCN